jgi:hypothetical protein
MKRKASKKAESLYAARARKEAALADIREMELRKLKGELVDVVECSKKWAAISAGMVSVILSSALTDDEKDALRSKLAELIQ